MGALSQGRSQLCSGAPICSHTPNLVFATSTSTFIFGLFSLLFDFFYLLFFGKQPSQTIFISESGMGPMAAPILFGVSVPIND